ncbi:MAG: hypothetical protein ACYC77_10310 [Coriobacteriia bacterium]
MRAEFFSTRLRHFKAIATRSCSSARRRSTSTPVPVAEFTTDGDVAIDPRLLSSDPEIASAMRKASFFLDERDGRELVGVWASMREIAGVPAKVTVDLLVPDALGGAGRRAARVPQHEKGSMLKVHGLEAALVDNSVVSIGALESTDARSFTMKVAGPTALLISKTIKLSERVAAGALERGRPDRVKPKDALDVLRLLQVIPSARLAEGFVGLLPDETAGPVTSQALGKLPSLFGDADSPGSQLAAEAAAPEPPEVIAASCAALCRELLGLLRAQGIVV